MPSPKPPTTNIRLPTEVAKEMLSDGLVAQLMKTLDLAASIADKHDVLVPGIKAAMHGFSVTLSFERLPSNPTE